MDRAKFRTGGKFLPRWMRSTVTPDPISFTPALSISYAIARRPERHATL
jgi:hypothetical protein